MMDETESGIIQDTDASGDVTTTTEHQENVSQTQKLQDIVESSLKDGEDGEKTEVDDTEKAKGPKKQSVQDRISSYATRAKEAEARTAAMTEEISTLKNDLAKIKTMFEHGHISKTDAEHEAGKATDAFQKLMTDIELPEDLEPYREHLLGAARKMAEAVMQPYIQREEEKALEGFRTEIQTNYKAVAEQFKDLYEPEPDKDGNLVMKPEFDKKAVEISREFDILMENGQTANPLISKKIGLEMLMTYLARPIEQARQVKNEVGKEREAVEIAKKGRVNSPSPSAAPAKPKTLQAIVESTIKEMGD